ncbi:MAG: DUF5658 family protein [Gammaproteobacteria bacterium]
MENNAEARPTTLTGERNLGVAVDISATGAAREITDRRRFTFKTILYGLIKPRRRGPRRGEDSDSYHADFFDRSLMFPAVGTVLLSAIDAMLTLIAIGNGLATEANAAMATLMENGNASFAGWKLFGTIVGVVLLISMANMRVLAGLRAKTILYFLFVGYTLLITYQLLNIYTA